MKDIEKYKKAWSQPGAMTAMLNWYRAAFWYRPSDHRRDACPRADLDPMGGKRQCALSRRMARPSLDYCEDGNLIFFPEATHWVQHEEAEEINKHLLQLVLT